MKPAGSFLLLSAGMALICPGSEPAKPKLSEHIRQEITAKLPVYAPKPATSTEGATTTGEPDPDVLVLSKIVVTEKRPPGRDPDDWLSESKIQQKSMVAYKTSMTDLEWALNSWYIPLITPPPSARARAAYRAGKIAAENERLSNVIRAIGVTDPKEAAKLKRELTRPAGSLPTPNP